MQVPKQTINAIKKGEFDPRLILAFKLSEYFSKSIKDMFEYQG